MAGESSYSTVTREVELAVRRLGALSVLPATANRFAAGLVEMSLDPDELIELVESEPALGVMVFDLAVRQTKSGGIYSIRSAVEQLTLRAIRDAFFSLGIYWPADGNGERVQFRRQLILNAAAVGSCARQIAEISQSGIDPDTAYTAGLMHSLGNLALDEAMPRSFATMIAQARGQGVNISDVQNENISLDYTILGKRLGARWHLAEQIQTAIWLHNISPQTIAQAIPQPQLAQAVHLAYLLARKFEIGQSGSFDTVEMPREEILPGLSPLKLESIGISVKQRLEAAGQVADSSDELAAYSGTIRKMASKLAVEGTKAMQESKRARTKSSHFDFTKEFLAGLTPVSEPIEIAERFACQWQKFYQTGTVCLYLTDNGGPVDAVVMENNRSSMVCLRPRENEPVIPQQIAGKFAIIDAADVCDWLFEQLQVEFDISQTKVAPLLISGKAIGAIVFEFRYPVETADLHEMFEATCFIAAAALGSAFARSEQQRFAERFARIAAGKPTAKTAPAVQRSEEVRPVGTDDSTGNISALAEFAAGAAHELNNPLSVISGRAQLLARTEADPTKKESLKQIQQNSGELSRIVEDLMGFAEPDEPRKALVAVKQIIDEAVQLTALKTGIDTADIDIQIAENVNDVSVDSGQVVSALANIISNALEAYEQGHGPVTISARRADSLVQINISDSGRGMDAEMLKKITWPFYSAKPAGRKRGMGLATADRLIELNGGSLSFESQPGRGTTATVVIPCL